MTDDTAPAAKDLAWLRALAVHRAERSVPTPGGIAVLTGTFPLAHDHNKLFVWSPCDPSELVAAADDVLGGAGLRHRRIEVQSERIADALESGLAAAGYSRETDLLMGWADGPVPQPAAPAAVLELSLEDRIAAGTQTWRTSLPDSGPEVWRQLGGRAATVADVATFLGVTDDDGTVVARADLYVLDGVAQVEDVNTADAHRGRGLASAVVLTAVRQALAAGARRIILVADADDWPQQLYRKLGFVDLCRTAAFSRLPTSGTG